MKYLIFFAILSLFLIGITSAQNSSLGCQYQERMDSGKTQQIFYDSSENLINNPLQFVFSDGQAENIGGPCNCKFSFTIKNNFEEKISMKLYYVSTIGANRHDNSADISLNPYESKTISGELGDMCWASCGIDSGSISYQINSDSEIKSKIEKILTDVCKQCNGKDCLNDGQNCSIDSNCGSGVCNIIGICGKDKIVDCPSGFKNCNNQSCLKFNAKKNGEKFSCEFECKSGYGEDGLCQNTVIQEILRYLFILLSLIILLSVIYYIWTGKNIMVYFNNINKK